MEQNPARMLAGLFAAALFLGWTGPARAFWLDGRIARENGALDRLGITADEKGGVTVPPVEAADEPGVNGDTGLPALKLDDIRGYDFWLPEGSRVEHMPAGVRVHIDLTLRFIYETHGKKNDYDTGRLAGPRLDSEGRLVAEIKLAGGKIHTAVVTRSSGTGGDGPAYTMWVRGSGNQKPYGPFNGTLFELEKNKPPRPPVTGPITAEDIKGLRFWILRRDSIDEGDLYGVWIEDDLSARVIYLANGKRNKSRDAKIAGVIPGASGESLVKIKFDYGKDMLLAGIRPVAEDLKKILAKFGKTPRYEMWMQDDNPAETGKLEHYFYDSSYEAD